MSQQENVKEKSEKTEWPRPCAMCLGQKKKIGNIRVTYGLDAGPDGPIKRREPYHTLLLCNNCSNKLWEKCAPMVNCNFMAWTNLPATPTDIPAYEATMERCIGKDWKKASKF